MGKSNYTLGSYNSIHPELLFSPLENISYNDIILITDLNNIYTYKVTTIEIVNPYRLDVLDPSEKPIITLMTCDNTLENRLIVQGDLIDTTPLDKADEKLLKSFDLAVNIPE